MTKIKTFIDRYNWEGINYPSEKEYWTKFDKNNLAISLNVFFAKNEKISPAYVSKHNSNRDVAIFVTLQCLLEALKIN